MSTARDADPAPREVLLEQDLRDGEQLVADDDVVARRRGARTASPTRTPSPTTPRRVLGALERGELLLERAVRRVAGPRVEVRRRAPTPSPGRPRPPSRRPCRTRTWPSRRSGCCARAWPGPAARPRGSRRVAKPCPSVRSRIDVAPGGRVRRRVVVGRRQSRRGERGDVADEEPQEDQDEPDDGDAAPAMRACRRRMSMATEAPVRSSASRRPPRHDS